MDKNRLQDLPLRTLLALHERGNKDALHVFVERLIDLELERCLYLRHNNPGFSPASSVADFDMPIHHCGYKQDRILSGDELSSDWHDLAKGLMSQLPPRYYVAALIWAAKENHMAKGAWGKTFEEINEELPIYLHLLGIIGNARNGVTYKNGRAINDTSLRARHRLSAAIKKSLGEESTLQEAS